MFQFHIFEKTKGYVDIIIHHYTFTEFEHG